MTALQKVQESLQAHLLTDDPEIAKYITGKNQEMVEERLAIYNSGYYARLLEVLESDYGVIAKLLGEYKFEQLGLAYITANPSRHFSANVYGQYMEKFLATSEPYAQQPHLSELASFIWALNCTVDAPDGPLLTTNDLATIPQDRWADMILSLHPSVALHSSDWNVLPVWQALIQNQQPPAITKHDKKAYCAVWRKDMQPYYCSLPKKKLGSCKRYNSNNLLVRFAMVCYDGTQRTWWPQMR